MVMQNMCFLLISRQHVNNGHANKQLGNSANWILY